MIADHVMSRLVAEAAEAFRHLFQMADQYDDTLKNEYSCLARLEE